MLFMQQTGGHPVEAFRTCLFGLSFGSFFYLTGRILTTKPAGEYDGYSV